MSRPFPPASDDGPLDTDPGRTRRLLTGLFETVLSVRGEAIRERVARLRAAFPAQSPDDLARLLVRQRAFYSGVAGGVASLGGIAALPLALPASLASSLFFQIEVVLSVAHLYGHDLHDEARRTDFVAVFLGDRAAEILRGGASTPRELALAEAQRFLTPETLLLLWKAFGTRLLARTGRRSLLAAARLVPVVAGPIGFAADYASTRSIGKAAVRYYRVGPARPEDAAEEDDRSFL